ncbi:hypothetical protein [Piscinibacter sp. XHJ-5]|uniref:hypothetical protein n=1 Tax=Piscinibacter sp. XHJ-5 TaxID=3037797 RepID=UPI0024531319|nr:hypothetical protein [Piscinibacter sp. XHJ-5]
MTTTTVSLQSSFRRNAPRLAQPIGRAVAHLVASVAAWMRPRQESPAEAASRLRSLANRYEGRQPGFAADLRAAADRHLADSER